MELVELERKIAIIQEKLSQKISTLNNGGCIHFAYYFSLALKRLKIPYKVYLAHSWRPIGNTYATFIAVSHVVVYVEGIGYIDGHNTDFSIKEQYKYCRQTKLNLDILRSSYKWNDAYRWKNNKTLEKIINTYLS